MVTSTYTVRRAEINLQYLSARFEKEALKDAKTEEVIVTGKETILLVDDEAAIIGVVKEMPKRWDIKFSLQRAAGRLWRSMRRTRTR